MITFWRWQLVVAARRVEAWPVGHSLPCVSSILSRMEGSDREMVYWDIVRSYTQNSGIHNQIWKYF